MRSLLISFLILVSTSVSVAQEQRLTRAYRNPENFRPLPISQTVRQAPFTFIQAKFDENAIRPDDTIAYRLARLIQLAELKPNKIEQEIRVIVADASSPALENSDKNNPQMKEKAVCFWIDHKSTANASDTAASDFFDQSICKDARAQIRIKHPALESENDMRVRMKSGSLNEIGHRIVAEEVLMHLYQLFPEYFSDSQLAFFALRRNIHPKNNEHLASIPHPDG